MDFQRLVAIVGDEPVFETRLLLAGDVDTRDVRRQLSRWVAGGRVYQLRRGVYTIAPPFQKVKPHPFVVANRLVNGSYVSCQAALAYYGLIPEHTPVVTSVTLGRPGAWDTALGRYRYHHITPALFWGYQALDVGAGQQAFVAGAEKALLDLVHLAGHLAGHLQGRLQAGGGERPFLEGLRLQHLERLDLDELRRHARRSGSPKLARAAEVVAALAQAEAEEYESL